MTTLAKTRPLLTFFALTYIFLVVAFIIQVLYAFGLVRLSAFSWYAIEVVFSPAAAALTVQWLTERNFKICQIYSSWKALASGIVLGPALILFSAVIVPAVLATKEPLQSLNWKAFLSASSYHCQYSGGFIQLLLAPIVEEPGWRGYALPRFQTRMSPGRASVLLGLLWAGWHIPSLFLGGSTLSGFLRYSSIVVALSVLMTLGFNLSKFSILVAFAMHAVNNMRGCVIEALASHATQRVNGSMIWTLSTFLVPVALILLTRGRLGLSPTHGAGANVKSLPCV